MHGAVFARIVKRTFCEFMFEAGRIPSFRQHLRRNLASLYNHIRFNLHQHLG